LGRQRALALGHRLAGLALGLPPQLDPVADVEAPRLARLLHQPDDLAYDAGPAKLVAQLEVERNGLAAGCGDGPAGPRRLADDDVVRADRDVLAVDRHRRRTARAQ